MTNLLLSASQSSTLLLTRTAAERLFLSTMNQVPVVVTWKGLRGHGLVCKEVVQRKTRAPAIGATLWMTSSDTGIGPNLSVLVGFSSLLILFSLIHIPGTLLAKKYTNSLTQAAIHEDEFAALSVGISEEIINLWTAKITAWEVDRQKSNPYFSPTSGTFDRVPRCGLT